MNHSPDMSSTWTIPLVCQQHEPFLCHVNNMNHSSDMSTTWTIPLACQQHEPFLWHVNNMNHSSVMWTTWTITLASQQDEPFLWHVNNMNHWNVQKWKLLTALCQTKLHLTDENVYNLTWIILNVHCLFAGHRRFNIDFKEIVYRRHVSNRGHRVFGWMSSEFFLMSIRNQ
jgi:hypothetical protein